MWKTWSGVADRVYLNDLLISLISFDVCVSAKIHGNVNVNFDFNRIDALFSSRSYSERKNLNNFALKPKMWKKRSHWFLNLPERKQDHVFETKSIWFIMFTFRAFFDLCEFFPLQKKEKMIPKKNQGWRNKKPFFARFSCTLVKWFYHWR